MAEEPAVPEIRTAENDGRRPDLSAAGIGSVGSGLRKAYGASKSANCRYVGRIAKQVAVKFSKRIRISCHPESPFLGAEGPLHLCRRQLHRSFAVTSAAQDEQSEVRIFPTSHEDGSGRKPAAHVSSKAACSVVSWPVARDRATPGSRASQHLLRACVFQTHAATYADAHRTKALSPPRSS